MTKRTGGVESVEGGALAAGAQLLSALRTVILEETGRAVGEVTAKLESRLAETPRGSAQTPDLKKLVEEIGASSAFKDRINVSLEQGLRNVLPQIVQRMKQEIDDRLKGKGSGGNGSEAPGVKSVVNSIEMKEMLEDRFRTMLLYLKQEVIPKEIQRHTLQP